MQTFNITPVAFMQSPYEEKFAIPRQPGLVPAAKGAVKLNGEFNNPHMIEGIEAFSHLWLQFVFHQTLDKGWKPKVRPPRLGGNAKVGVFATRSTFRPNGLGLSVVKLEGVSQHQGQWQLDVSGFDLLDQTPIVDIKPYIGYSDALPHSNSGFASDAPTLMTVTFAPEVALRLNHNPEFAELIRQVLAQDPRPAYRKSDTDQHVYGMRLARQNVNWQVIDNQAVVTSLSDC
ncbi:MAG: tRNA (N6-threonylcarbamoyladenosine(37)-N6)-methyltransferase TrmO [Idiomarina sp.]|nr:tRNA (N6-threonylcarbamoyladenosine(37)-N6)-methyltransferase TrmO [Idiomarina sp.]